MSKTTYKIQIGAYRKKENAEKMVAKLKKKNIPAAIIEADGLMKVQCGAFTVKANADKRLAEVQKAGFLNAVMLTIPGSEPAPGIVQTGWKKVLAVLTDIMNAKNPHQAVIDILKKHGHTLKWDSAWCSETVVSAFLEAGLVDLIGGYTTNAPSLKKHAKELGIWHSGSSGIMAGDIVLYGSGEPNHTEIAVDGTYNISGNYNGTVKKRKRAGRTINGHIRPKYPVEEKKEPEHPKVRAWAIRFWESNIEKYGDATAFIQYGADNKSIDHVILVDTGMNHSDTVKKLQAAGVKKIDAILISHDHSDHYGFLETILDKFKVGYVYFPDQTGVRKYQASYADRMVKQAAKCTAKKVQYKFLKAGDRFRIGVIECRAIFQADASKLKEKDNHHFINNMGLACHIIVDGTWTFHMAGDMQADSIGQMLGKMPDLKCDVFKIQWHGDRGAITHDLAKAMSPAVAFSNYHNKSSHGARQSTYAVLEAVGCDVFKNWEDGEIYMDMQDKTMTVTGSKSGRKKVVKK